MSRAVLHLRRSSKCAFQLSFCWMDSDGFTSLLGFPLGGALAVLTIPCMTWLTAGCLGSCPPFANQFASWPSGGCKAVQLHTSRCAVTSWTTLSLPLNQLLDLLVIPIKLLLVLFGKKPKGFFTGANYKGVHGSLSIMEMICHWLGVGYNLGKATFAGSLKASMFTFLWLSFCRVV